MKQSRLILVAIVVVAGWLVWRRAAGPPAVRLPVSLGSLIPSAPGEPNEARDQIRALGTNAVPALVAELDRQPAAKWKFLAWLRQQLPPQLAAQIPQSHQPEYRKNVAIWMLGELGPAARHALPALQTAAADPSDHERHARAVIALARIQPDQADAWSNVLRLLSSPQQSVRYFATFDFGAFTNHPQVELAPLIAALQDADGEVRANAAGAIAQFGPEASNALPQLRVLLNDPYRHVSTCAALALVRLDPDSGPAAVAAATNALGRRAEMSEFVAPKVFAAAGSNAVLAVPFLEAALAGNETGFPKTRAAVALWGITHQMTPELLRELDLLREPSLEVVATLGEIGPAASNAIPELQKLTRVGYRPLREAATEALRRITNAPAPPPR